MFLAFCGRALQCCNGVDVRCWERYFPSLWHHWLWQRLQNFCKSKLEANDGWCNCNFDLCFWASECFCVEWIEFAELQVLMHFSIAGTAKNTGHFTTCCTRMGGTVMKPSNLLTICTTSVLPCRWCEQIFAFKKWTVKFLLVHNCYFLILLAFCLV